MPLKRLLFISLLAILKNLASAQTFYYVSPNGNDANNGTTINTPWRTLNKACASATAGSIVYFRGGIYPTQNAEMGAIGSLNNYTQFKNYPNENPIIDGGGINQTLLKIENKSYIIIDGLHFTNSKGNSTYGILISGSSHHIQIRNCKISEISTLEIVQDTARCRYVNALPLKICGAGANNIILDNNEVFNCITGCSEAISISGNVTDFQISNNNVHDNGNIGIVVAGQYNNFCTGLTQNGTITNNTVYRCKFAGGVANKSAAGIYVDGAKRVNVERNRVYECNVGIQIGCENTGAFAEFDTVRNNIVYNNDLWGIGMGGTNGTVRNSSLINNSCFYNNGHNFGTYFANFGEICLQNVQNSSILNNLCYVRYQATHAVFMKWEYPTSTIGMTINNNNYYTPDAASSGLKFVSGQSIYTYSQYKTLTGHDANSITQNPNLYNPTLPHPELHLNETSPLINQGVNPSWAGKQDYDENPRVLGSKIDIGAYESQCCGYKYRLYGNPPINKKFFTISSIGSSSSLPTSNNNTYSAGNFTELHPNFHANTGSNLLIIPTKWTDVFFDDFNQSNTFSRNWQTANRQDYNSSKCYYQPNIPQLSTFEGKSCLQITAVKISDNVFHSGHVKSTFNFTPSNNELYHLKSSIKLIAKQGSTIKNFSQTYGAWPAFWTVNETAWPTMGEIDIIEIYSKSLNNIPFAEYKTNIHYSPQANSSLANQETLIPNIIDGWHTYEMYWRNENGTHTVTILLDDKIVACFKNSSISNLQLQAFQSHSIIFNLNIGSNSNYIFNSPINIFDQTSMYVDYIKVRKAIIN